MNVLVTDDKKEKSQSWEATATEYFSDSDSHSNFSITGYGKTKADAIAQFKDAAKFMIKNLQTLIDDENIGV